MAHCTAHNAVTDTSSVASWKYALHYPRGHALLFVSISKISLKTKN